MTENTTDADGPRKYLRIAEAAAQYQVDPQTIRRWLRQGAPHVRRGRVVRVPASGLHAWLSQKAATTP